MNTVAGSGVAPRVRRPWLAGALGATVATAAGAAAAASPKGVAALLAAGAAASFALAIPAVWVAHGLSLASFLSGVPIPLGELNVRPEQAVGLLAGLGLLARRGARRLEPLSVLVGAWLVAGVAGALGEPEPERAFVHAARLAATLVPLLALPSLLDRGDAERAWNGFLLLAVIEAAIGIAAAASNALTGSMWGITPEPVLGYVHPHGTLLEPNVLGALSAAAAVALVLRARDSRLSVRARLLAGAGVLVTLGAVAVSLTRAAWLAFPVVLAALWVAAPLRAGQVRRGLLRLAVALTLGAVAAAGAVSFLASRGLPETDWGVAGKIGSLSRVSTDPNVLIRLRTYREALRIFRDAPLLGAGHGAMERIPGFEDHTMAWAGNLEVHLLADTGAIGLLTFLAFVGLALARVARAARSGPGRHAERLGALLVVLICAHATETSWLSSFWMLFALALAAAPGPRAEEARTRVLYVHPSDELYGSDRVLLDLVRRLDRTRFEPQVLLSTDVPYAGRLTRRLTEIGVPVHRMRIGVLRRRILTSPLALARYALDVVSSTARIWRLLRRERIAVVHANTVTVFPAALAARLAGRRLVWHLHEIVTDRPGRALLHGLVRLLADRVVVVSDAAGDSLSGTGRRIATVIPNGIEGRPPLGPPASPPLVAYVGRLSARKGPDVLLRAMASLGDRHPAARLVFCGDEFGGGEAIASELRALAARLGVAERVELQPFREDVTDLLQAATVVVSPSVLPESFGLILLEAMASGRAVIASDHGGPRELVVDGETGFLVPPGDEAALAAALDRLLADPALATRLGEAGRARARARFSLDASVRRFEELYLRER